MSGPDMINSLVGVLLWFRKDLVGIVADIEQMFYCFVVSEEHRDILRFFWFRDNDTSNNLIEYRMRVHVFGNSPSLSIANYCLLKTAETSSALYGHDVFDFVSRSVYIDDGLVSLPSADKALDQMTRTRDALSQGGNLRLHKIASNSRQDVMKAFSSCDIASDLQNIDLGVSDLPMQLSLGLYWKLQCDSFTYCVSLDEKPFSRRGVLSVVNSLYDPLGFIAPIVVQGKFILRELMRQSKDWDEPLPVSMRDDWDKYFFFL